MEPYIMIFSKDNPEQALDFGAGTVYADPEKGVCYVRGKETGVEVFDGDVLIKFERPEQPGEIDFYLIGKEHFYISEEEKKVYGT